MSPRLFSQSIVGVKVGFFHGTKVLPFPFILYAARRALLAIFARIVARSKNHLNFHVCAQGIPSGPERRTEARGNQIEALFPLSISPPAPIGLGEQHRERMTARFPFRIRSTGIRVENRRGHVLDDRPQFLRPSWTGRHQFSSDRKASLLWSPQSIVSTLSEQK